MTKHHNGDALSSFSTGTVITYEMTLASHTRIKAHKTADGVWMVKMPRKAKGALVKLAKEIQIDAADIIDGAHYCMFAVGEANLAKVEAMMKAAREAMPKKAKKAKKNDFATLEEAQAYLEAKAAKKAKKGQLCGGMLGTYGVTIEQVMSGPSMLTVPVKATKKAQACGMCGETTKAKSGVCKSCQSYHNACGDTTPDDYGHGC